MWWWWWGGGGGGGGQTTLGGSATLEATLGMAEKQKQVAMTILFHAGDQAVLQMDER